MLGAYLDDTLVGLPAAAAARVPELAAAAFAPAGLTIQPAKTKVWVPAGLCPAGCADWWAPRGLRVLGAPAETDTPLATLGELGAAVGDRGKENQSEKERTVYPSQTQMHTQLRHESKTLSSTTCAKSILCKCICLNASLRVSWSSFCVSELYFTI